MRKFRARKNRGGAGKREKFPPFFFRVRAFSIPLARLSRSLEQAKDERPANSGDVLSLTRQHTVTDSDYASPGKMCLQTRFGRS